MRLRPRADGRDGRGRRTWSPPAQPQETASTWIDAPVLHVWTLMTQVERMPDWYEGWTAARDRTGHDQLTVGSAIELSGSRRSAVCHLEQVDAPHRISWIELRPGFPPSLVTFETAAEGAGTRLTYTRARYEARPTADPGEDSRPAMSSTTL